jgi:hypothetical protein
MTTHSLLDRFDEPQIQALIYWWTNIGNAMGETTLTGQRRLNRSRIIASILIRYHGMSVTPTMVHDVAYELKAQGRL